MSRWTEGGSVGFNAAQHIAENIEASTENSKLLGWAIGCLRTSDVEFERALGDVLHETILAAAAVIELPDLSA